MRRTAVLVLVATGCLQNDTDLSLRVVAADLHMHHVCPAGRYSSEDLRDRMEREAIEVGAVLVAAQNYEESVVGFTGRDDAASRPGRILHDDLEVSGFPAAGFGHLVLLGLSSIRLDVNGPRTLTPLVDEATARDPRVVVGYAHGWAWPGSGFPVPGAYGVANCCIPFELPVDVTQGKVAFLAEELNERNAAGVTTFDGGPLTVGTSVLWRTLMNSGYRLALTGGSDILCLNDTVGAPRTLALVEGPVSYEGTLEAVRRGRTAVAAGKGYRLDLRVDGVRVGDELAFARPREVALTVERDFAESAPVEITVNGAVVKTLTAGAKGTETVNVSVAKSAWIAARARRVQTSAVYVSIAGQPIRGSAEDTCFLVRYVDHLRALVEHAARPEAQLYLQGPERAAALARYEAAGQALLARFREAGGVDCR